MYGQAVTPREFVLNAIAAGQKELAADQEWGWANTAKMMKPLEKALEELRGVADQPGSLVKDLLVRDISLVRYNNNTANMLSNKSCKHIRIKCQPIV